MQKSTEQIIVNIIRKEMILDDQSIWVEDQNRKIPNDDKMYVTVGFESAGILSNTNNVVETEEGMTEIQQVIANTNITIDLFSRSNEAMIRRFEVLQALTSVYSVQQQEKYNFRIFNVPEDLQNTSAAEGGSQLKRYTVLFRTQACHIKQKVLSSCDGNDYYDDFKSRVDDEDSIGLDNGIIEFEITENTII